MIILLLFLIFGVILFVFSGVSFIMEIHIRNLSDYSDFDPLECVREKNERHFLLGD